MKVTDEMIEAAMLALLGWPHIVSRASMRAAIEAALAVMPKPMGTVGEMMPHQTLRDERRRIARNEVRGPFPDCPRCPHYREIDDRCNCVRYDDIDHPHRLKRMFFRFLFKIWLQKI